MINTWGHFDCLYLGHWLKQSIIFGIIIVSSRSHVLSQVTLKRNKSSNSENPVCCMSPQSKCSTIPSAVETILLSTTSYLPVWFVTSNAKLRPATCLNTCHHHIGPDSFAFVAYKLKRMSFNCICLVQTVTIRSECWTEKSGGGEIRAVNV